MFSQKTQLSLILEQDNFDGEGSNVMGQLAAGLVAPDEISKAQGLQQNGLHKDAIHYYLKVMCALLGTASRGKIQTPSYLSRSVALSHPSLSLSTSRGRIQT